MLPLLKGERPKDWRKSLYYHFYEYPAEHAVKRHYGVRTERYKLISIFLFSIEVPKNLSHCLSNKRHTGPSSANFICHYGVRTERYKLIHFYNDIDAWELYDLKKDPREMHNLFGINGTPVLHPLILFFPPESVL